MRGGLAWQRPKAGLAPKKPPEHVAFGPVHAPKAVARRRGLPGGPAREALHSRRPRQPRPPTKKDRGASVPRQQVAPPNTVAWARSHVSRHSSCYTGRRRASAAATPLAGGRAAPSRSIMLHAGADVAVILRAGSNSRYRSLAPEDDGDRVPPARALSPSPNMGAGVHTFTVSSVK